MLFKLLFLLCIYETSSIRYVTRLKKENFDLDNAAKIFEGFIKKFGKHYDTEAEHTRRFKIFKKNLEDVNNRNKNATTEVYGITEFLDKTDEEFNRDYTSLKWNPNLEDLYEEPDDLHPMIDNNGHYNEVPDSWDWRDQGVVTPVKYQGYCRSCWAFSAIGCVESQFAIKNGTLKVLSEQQLVDCFHRGGCEAGDLAHIALNEVAKKGGLITLQEYNNNKVVESDKCSFSKVKNTVKVKGARVLKISDEEQLKKLVFEYGPVSVALEFTRGFEQYKGGIGTDTGLGCAKHHNMNHSVLFVGYGIEKGVPYWIIKNSHGRNWGEQGFMKLIRGRKACSILQYVAIADLL